MPLDPLAKTDGQCVDCRGESPPYDAARSAGIYEGALRHAIHLLKYSLIRALADPLGDFIAETVAPPFPVDMLIPVPLYPARQRMRGFNQAELLAERVAARWGVSVETSLLFRTQQTTPQMLLPREERLDKVKGVFAASRVPAGRMVGLIDDVYTTGATLRECSRVLRAAGAERILVISLARALPAYA